MEIKWDERYRMGIETFDADHKQLFQIVQRMIDRLHDGGIEDEKKRLFFMCEGRKYLKSYWIRHALAEEAYMREIGYPQYAMHKKAHDDFLKNRLQSCDNIMEKKGCSKQELMAFIGQEVGWLLEHITTMDLAIVGKGYLKPLKGLNLDQELLTEALNELFKATMNMDVQARIVDAHYTGGQLREAIFHEITFRKGEIPFTLVIGLEKHFVVEAVKSLYGGDIEEYEAMVLSTIDIFGVSFWHTFGQHILGDQADFQYVESHIRITRHVEKMLAEKPPKISYLFAGSKGQFFIASDQILSSVRV